MSRHTWKDLVRHGSLPDLLRIFSPHIVKLILEERRRT